MPSHKVGDKTDVILAGAEQEFVSCGYAAASMDRIAVAAGVSKPTLYSYFRDKAGLFAGLIQEMIQSEKMRPVVDREKLFEMSARDCLTYIATVALDRVSGKQPLFTLIRLIIAESGRFPRLAQAFVKNGEKPILDELTYLFANHPEINASDPEVAARCFQGSIVYHIILQEILHGEEVIPLARDRFISGLVDTILNQ
jgi:AcrR family transcriptional regulator